MVIFLTPLTLYNSFIAPYRSKQFKGSLGPTFVPNSFNERNREATFWPYPPREISDLTEVTHVLLRYLFKEVPPQSNCPQDDFIFRS